MRKEKIVAAAVAAGLLFSLSACGKVPEDPSASVDIAQQEETISSDSPNEETFLDSTDTPEDAPEASSSDINLEEEPPYTLGKATTHRIYQTEDGLRFVNGDAGFALSLPEEWEGKVELSYDDTACRVKHEGDLPFLIHAVRTGDGVYSDEITLGSNADMTYYFCVNSSLDATAKKDLLQVAKNAFFMLDLGEEDFPMSGVQAASTDGMFYVNTDRGITIRLPKEMEDQFGNVRYDAGSVYFYQKPAAEVEEEGQQVYQKKWSPFYVYFITSEQAARGVMEEIEQKVYDIEERNGIHYYVVLEEESGRAEKQVQQVKAMISWLDTAQS